VSRRGWTLFVVMGVIWGIPYLLIKVAVEELSPPTLVLARTAIGAVLLLPFAIARGQLRPLLARWRPFLIYTVIEICIPWLLLSYAEQRLSSSLTGLLIAAVSTGEHERLDGRRLLGLILGVAGVGALVGFEISAGDVWSVLAIAGVAICYAIGPVILSRQLAQVPAMGVVAASLGLAALVYVPAGLALAPRRWPSAGVIGAVVILAAVCTALAFLLFLALVAEVGPARSVVITYLNPAVAVLLGVVLLDELFTTATAVGFVLILAGSVLATARAAPDRRAARLRAAPSGGAGRDRLSSVDVDCADLGQAVPEP